MVAKKGTRRKAPAKVAAKPVDAEEAIIEGADAETPAAEPEAQDAVPEQPVAEGGLRIAEGDAPLGFETVENIVPGSDITLHDGSHLLFGESAHVPEMLAWELCGRRQAR